MAIKTGWVENMEVLNEFGKANLMQFHGLTSEEVDVLSVKDIARLAMEMVAIADVNDDEEKGFEELRPEWFTWFILTVCDPLVRRTSKEVLYNSHMDLEDHLRRVKAFPKDDDAWDELHEHIWRRYRLQKGLILNPKAQERELICDDMFKALRGFWTTSSLEDGLHLLRQAGRLARKMMIDKGPFVLIPDAILYPEDLYRQILIFDPDAEMAV